VAIKSGVEVKRLTTSTVVFSDDSELDADVVIFASVSICFSSISLSLIHFSALDITIYVIR
jgi:hypothetical protein